MIVRHNLSAMNSHRQMGTSNSSTAKNLEKLSAGFKINRAGDDAAGLAISEKMRGQIRGLDMAQKNIGDGISLTNVIDGAMQEDHSMLQRMRELLVQASNGTYSEIDRGMLQKEIDQLMHEIDQMSYRSEFNGIRVLRNKAAGFPEWVGIENDPVTHKMLAGSYTAHGNTYTAAKIDFSGVNSYNAEELVNNGFNHTCCTCSTRYSIKFVDNEADSFTGNNADGHILCVNISGVTTGEEMVARIMDAAVGTGALPPLDTTKSLNGLNNHYTRVAVDDQNPSVLVVYDCRPGQTPGAGSSGLMEPGVWGEPYVPFDNGLPIQCGANANEVIKIPMTTIDTATLGLRTGSGIKVTPIEVAQEGITMVDGAINMLSTKRADVGAVQNRLGHALNNVANTHENLQSAESSIRDVDMAKEMMDFTKNNILSQASQSMLAQANQMPQGILQLLAA